PAADAEEDGVAGAALRPVRPGGRRHGHRGRRLALRRSEDEGRRRRPEGHRRGRRRAGARRPRPRRRDRLEVLPQPRRPGRHGQRRGAQHLRRARRRPGDLHLGHAGGAERPGRWRSVSKDPRDIILRPVVSEKSYALLDANVYTFVVAPSANKIEIRQAVEEIFNVKVLNVTTMNRRGKRKRNRRTNTFGQRSTTKRAVVKVAGEDRIDIFGS